MNVRKVRYPVFGKWLLSFFLNHSHPETMMGDFEEMYVSIAKDKGIFINHPGYSRSFKFNYKFETFQKPFRILN